MQLPNEPSKPEWKLEGQVVTVPDIPLNLLVSTLRDRILQFLGNTPVPLSRIRLSYAGRMLPNQNTLAAHNIEDEDLIVLSLRDANKK